MEKTRAGIERSTNLLVPHGKGIIKFAHPSIGPNTYRKVGKQILDSGMKVPTGDYTASLLHTTYCNDSVANELEFKDVGHKMRSNWLWVFNRDFWTSEGVYVLPDLKAMGRSQPLNQKNLEKMLKGSKEINGVRMSKGGRIRFAEKGSYKIGEHTHESLAKDGFVIASYGIEGAEKLGEVSTKFKYDPRTLGLNIEKGQSPELRVSALVDGGGLYGEGLLVYGNDFGDDWDGPGFGVLK